MHDPVSQMYEAITATAVEEEAEREGEERARGEVARRRKKETRGPWARYAAWQP